MYHLSKYITFLRVRHFLLVMMILLILFLPSCAKPADKVTLSIASAEKTVYPMIIKDDSGADVIIEHKPLKIISLLPSSTEILFALGQEKYITAVTKWDNYPETIREMGYELFDDALKPDLNRIQNLQPDLIIIGTVSGDSLRKLRSLKIPVVVFNPQSIEQTYETIRKVGNITDTHREAMKLILSMELKEKKVQQTISKVKEEQKPRVWLEVSPDLSTPGRNTFLNELITKAGGKSISTDLEGWGQQTPEQIVEKNPQVIFYTYGQYTKNALENIKSRPNWQNIEAVKNDRIIELDNDLITRPGPRIIDGLEAIAKTLYADLF